MTSTATSTHIQVLDLTARDDPVTFLGLDPETPLPTRTPNTVVRHLKCMLLDFGTFIKYVLRHHPFSQQSAATVCQLLERFRREQERDSNHGRYFEAGRKSDNDGLMSFLSVPYVTYTASSEQMDEIRRNKHPSRSLFQHYYRRESAKAISERDRQQICARVAGGGRKIMVEEVWILRLDGETVITASSTPGEDLWLKLKLFENDEAVLGKRGVVDMDRRSFSMTRTPSNSVGHLSKDVSEVLSGLGRVRYRIRQMMPRMIAKLLDVYEKHVVHLVDAMNRYRILRMVFKPRIILFAVHRIGEMSIDRAWLDSIATSLVEFTEFVELNFSTWTNLIRTDPFRSSDELQSLLTTLYSKVLSYAAQFLRQPGPPLRRNPAWKTRVDNLFKDVMHLSSLLEETAEIVRLRANVLAAAGLPEESYRPTTVNELILLILGILLPEDSTRTSRAYISEVYAQYLATLQFESSQNPSKALVKNINQIAEELDIMHALVKTQHKVISRMRTEQNLPQVEGEMLDVTLQKLDFFLADLEEYKRSCVRLAKLTAQHVEMQMEHHGKAIVVFTVVTIVFLPMSFVASVFGMNTRDIREMENSQWLFWTAASAVTVVVVVCSLVVAFYGDRVTEVGRRWVGGRGG